MRLYDDQLIVITGAAGFIGSGLIRHLNSRGQRNIIVVDNLGVNGKWRNLVGKQFVDIIPVLQLFPWLKEYESAVWAIVHLGACSSTVETDADYLLDNNYRYSVKLAQWALRHEKRFIYASSAATYGNGSQGFVDDHLGLEALRPLNMYGYSKHLFDLWALNEGVLSNVVGLKYFNVFGPNEYHKGRMASPIGRMVESLSRDKPICLFKSSEPSKYADGDQKRDFIYVKDTARMTAAFLDNEVGGIFNIGRGRAESWNTVASATCKGLDQADRIDYIPMPVDLLGKYQNYTCADMVKTGKVLGVGVKTKPLAHSVEEYVRDYLVPRVTW